MTNEEIIEITDTLNANDKTMKEHGISDNLWGKAVECIMFLQSENAALRERLDKAVELPCKVGDNVFCIVGIDPAVEEFEVEEILIKRTDPIFAFFRLRGIDIGVKTSCVLSQFGKRWFTELEAAEARLAELKGGKE